jgi:hypothetical protein
LNSFVARLAAFIPSVSGVPPAGIQLQFNDAYVVAGENAEKCGCADLEHHLGVQQHEVACADVKSYARRLGIGRDSYLPRVWR